MPLFVFECEGCQGEIKHVTSAPLTNSYLEDCVSCKQRMSFKFVREGNRENDWFANILIQNRRRRDGDLLYKTKKKKKSKPLAPLKIAS